MCLRMSQPAAKRMHPHPPPLQIGPNVSIGAHARVGAGVRLSSCIVLDEVEIKVRRTFHMGEGDRDIESASEMPHSL